jgi:endonuclease G
LETWLRKQAANGNTIFIYTGPMFKECQCTNSIGNNVLVPTAFYKAVYNENPTNEAMIAFLVPNVGTNAPLSEFAMSIDELEGILKMDFFKELPIEKQDELESKLELDKWTGL